MPEILLPAQIDALQQVELRLGWISHGYNPTQIDDGFPAVNGPAQLGVSDNDFAVPAQLLVGMGKGDVSARESTGDSVWTHETVLERVGSILSRSPYVAQQPLQTLSGYKDLRRSDLLKNIDPETISNVQGLPEALNSSAELIRMLWLASPFIYVDALAAARGIRRAIADSSPERYARLKKNIEDIAIRDQDMVRALGEIAVEMQSYPPQLKHTRPILSFLAGRGHKGVEHKLKEYNIPFSSQTAREPLLSSIRRFASISRGHTDREKRRKYIQITSKLWFENVRSLGHKPKDERITPP